MCIFSARRHGLLESLIGRGRVSVADTRIFARLDGATQLLAYSMRVSTSADVAMVLPVPVALNGGGETLSFVDLSSYPALFEDLELLFPPIVAPQALGSKSAAFAPPLAALKVWAVGSFEASYVPTTADFDRLDPRFRLAPEVWEALHRYGSFGFAVFKLQPGKG